MKDAPKKVQSDPVLVTEVDEFEEFVEKSDTAASNSPEPAGLQPVLVDPVDELVEFTQKTANIEPQGVNGKPLEPSGAPVLVDEVDELLTFVDVNSPAVTRQ
jgi:hypothetical protein